MTQELLTREEIESILSWPVSGKYIHELCYMALAYLDTLADSKTPSDAQKKALWVVQSYIKDATDLVDVGEDVEIPVSDLRTIEQGLSAKDNKNEQ